MRKELTQGNVTGVIETAGQVIAIDAVENTYDQLSNSQVPEAQLSSLLKKTGFVSASVLGMKAKQFDDGLYAAVDLLAENSKAPFIRRIVEATLKTQPNAVSTGMVRLAAATMLSKEKPSLPSNLGNAAQSALNEFLSMEILSKPMGFYTWSTQLSDIFRRDRLLQSRLVDTDWVEVVRTLSENPDLRQTYLSVLKLNSRLTNPLSNVGLGMALTSPEWSPSEEEEFGFFPPSTSPENELMKKLIRQNIDVGSLNIIEQIIEHVQNGELNLTPTELSGWYDWQIWSLEPFIALERMPERKALQPTYRYNKYLRELFKGFYALTRETHVKQLEVMIGCMPMPTLHLHPELTVEPLPSHYYRKALSYRFIRETLIEHFGDAALGKISRLTEQGPVSSYLLDELHQIEQIFWGACLVACEELALEDVPEIPEVLGYSQKDAIKTFRNWSVTISRDPDLSRDARMMVPIFVNNDGSIKVWVCLGWGSQPLLACYVRPPTVLSATAPKSDFYGRAGDVRIDKGNAELQAAYPIAGEVTVNRLMNRAEFQQFCEHHRSKRAILEALSSGARV